MECVQNTCICFFYCTFLLSKPIIIIFFIAIKKNSPKNVSPHCTSSIHSYRKREREKFFRSIQTITVKSTDYNARLGQVYVVVRQKYRSWCIKCVTNCLAKNHYIWDNYILHICVWRKIFTRKRNNNSNEEKCRFNAISNTIHLLQTRVSHFSLSLR